MEGGGGFLQAQGLRDDTLDPDRASRSPYPISLWPAIEMAHRLRPLSMQEAASLCGTTTCGVGVRSRGGAVWHVRLRRTAAYAGSYKRTSEKTPFYDVGCIGATGIARGPLLCASKNPPRFREGLSSRQLGEWDTKAAYLLWLTSRVSSSQSNIR
jgi:hypothetical protein